LPKRGKLTILNMKKKLRLSKMKKKIKRVYHDYRNWECYKNNMYIERKMEERDFFVAKALELLRDTDKLKIQMLRSVDEWFYSTEQYMTVIGSNRQAWLGQAARSEERRVGKERRYVWVWW